MRSKTAQSILDKTLKEVKIFAKLYADLLIKTNDTLKQKGMTHKASAEEINKRPFEIHKWLSGEHNLTLRSIAKLEAELEQTLIEIPQKKF